MRCLVILLALSFLLPVLPSRSMADHTSYSVGHHYRPVCGFYYCGGPIRRIGRFFYYRRPVRSAVAGAFWLGRGAVRASLRVGLGVAQAAGRVVGVTGRFLFGRRF